MAFRLNEQHALSLIQPQLQPGEQIVRWGRGIEKPWWTRIFLRVGIFFWRNFIVVGTTQRLIFIKHKGLLGGYATKSVDSFAWNQLDRIALGWGVFNKNLVAQSSAHRFRRTVTMGRFWTKNNFGAGEAILSTWSERRAALPAPTAYAAPSLSAPMAGGVLRLFIVLFPPSSNRVRNVCPRAKHFGFFIIITAICV